MVLPSGECHWVFGCDEIPQLSGIVSVSRVLDWFEEEED